MPRRPPLRPPPQAAPASPPPSLPRAPGKHEGAPSRSTPPRAAGISSLPSRLLQPPSPPDIGGRCRSVRRFGCLPGTRSAPHSLAHGAAPCPHWIGPRADDNPRIHHTANVRDTHHMSAVPFAPAFRPRRTVNLRRRSGALWRHQAGIQAPQAPLRGGDAEPGLAPHTAARAPCMPTGVIAPAGKRVGARVWDSMLPQRTLTETAAASPRGPHPKRRGPGEVLRLLQWPQKRPPGPAYGVNARPGNHRRRFELWQ